MTVVQDRASIPCAGKAQNTIDSDIMIRRFYVSSTLLNPLVPELFCHKFDLLEIVSFLCTFLQHAVR